MIKNIDHIGYAVKNMETALKTFRLLGYDFSDIKVDEYRKVNVCIAKSQGGGKC